MTNEIASAQLIKAARDALPMLEALVNPGSAGLKADDIADVISRLRTALPHEYLCRDCGERLKTQKSFNGAYQARCVSTSCQQTGPWRVTEQEALEAASKDSQ